MDDLNLYDDLDEFHEQQEKKSKELQEAEEKYEQSLKTIEELKAENKTLKKNIQRIELGFQSLLDTARSEINRKNKEIERLRKEKDDICFRRKIPATSVNTNNDSHLVNNPFKHSAIKVNEISITESAVITPTDVSEEVRQKTETLKRTCSNDDVKDRSDSKRLRVSLNDGDDKYQHSSYKHHYVSQKTKDQYQSNRVGYREDARNRNDKSHSGIRRRDSGDHDGRFKYEKSKSSERNGRYEKEPHRNRSRERDKPSYNFKESSRSKERHRTHAFSKSSSKSPLKRDKSDAGTKHIHTRNEKIHIKTDTENSKKVLIKELGDKDTKYFLTEHKAITAGNLSKGREKEVRSAARNSGDLHIQTDQIEKQTSSSINIKDKPQNNFGLDFHKEPAIKASEKTALNTPPMRLEIFNELFGKSPSVCESISKNSASTPIQPAQIEVISSVTTSPENYTDITSEATTPTNKIIETTIPASGTSCDEIIWLDRKRRDEINECFIPNANAKGDFKTIGCDDMGNELDFVHIPGLDLCSKSKITATEDNVNALIPIRDKLETCNKNPDIITQPLPKEEQLVSFNDENILKTNDLNKMKSEVKIATENCDNVNKNPAVRIAHDSTATSTTTDNVDITKEVCTFRSKELNIYEQSLEARSCINSLLDRRKTALTTSLTVDKVSAKELDIASNVINEFSNEVVAIDAKQCGGVFSLKNPYKIKKNERESLNSNTSNSELQVCDSNSESREQKENANESHISDNPEGESLSRMESLCSHTNDMSKIGDEKSSVKLFLEGNKNEENAILQRDELKPPLIKGENSIKVAQEPEKAVEGIELKDNDDETTLKITDEEGYLNKQVAKQDCAKEALFKDQKSLNRCSKVIVQSVELLPPIKIVQYSPSCLAAEDDANEENLVFVTKQDVSSCLPESRNEIGATETERSIIKEALHKVIQIIDLDSPNRIALIGNEKSLSTPRESCVSQKSTKDQYDKVEHQVNDKDLTATDSNDKCLPQVKILQTEKVISDTKFPPIQSILSDKSVASSITEKVLGLEGESDASSNAEQHCESIFQEKLPSKDVLSANSQVVRIPQNWEEISSSTEPKLTVPQEQKIENKGISCTVVPEKSTKDSNITKNLNLEKASTILEERPIKGNLAAVNTSMISVDVDNPQTVAEIIAKSKQTEVEQKYEILVENKSQESISSVIKSNEHISEILMLEEPVGNVSFRAEQENVCDPIENLLNKIHGIQDDSFILKVSDLDLTDEITESCEETQSPSTALMLTNDTQKEQLQNPVPIANDEKTLSYDIKHKDSETETGTSNNTVPKIGFAETSSKCQKEESIRTLAHKEHCCDNETYMKSTSEEHGNNGTHSFADETCSSLTSKNAEVIDKSSKEIKTQGTMVKPGPTALENYDNGAAKRNANISIDKIDTANLNKVCLRSKPESRTISDENVGDSFVEKKTQQTTNKPKEFRDDNISVTLHTETLNESNKLPEHLTKEHEIEGRFKEDIISDKNVIHIAHSCEDDKENISARKRAKTGFDKLTKEIAAVGELRNDDVKDKNGSCKMNCDESNFKGLGKANDSKDTIKTKQKNRSLLMGCRAADDEPESHKQECVEPSCYPSCEQNSEPFSCTENLCGAKKEHYAWLQKQLPTGDQGSCAKGVISLQAATEHTAENTCLDDFVKSDNKQCDPTEATTKQFSKEHEITTPTFSLTTNILSQGLLDAKKLVCLKKVVSKEINIEGEIVEVVKDIADLHGTPTKAKVMKETSKLANKEQNTTNISTHPQQSTSVQPENDVLPAISTETFPILPSISATCPTPPNFSGIFSKIPTSAATSEDDLNKLKKKSPHLNTKPKEYILPAASVLCNVDNLENATKNNKKLHWELLDNKSEMTEIEDDADIDTTDNEELKVQRNTLENLCSLSKQKNVQKSSPSDTDTQTEDESGANDVRQQKGKYKNVKQPRVHKIEPKLPENIKAGVQDTANRKANAIVDDSLALQAPSLTVLAKRSVGRPRKRLDKSLAHKKKGRKLQQISESGALESSSQMYSYKKEPHEMKQNTEDPKCMESFDVESKSEKLQTQISSSKCDGNYRYDNDNNKSLDECVDLKSVENSMRNLSSSAEKLKTCGEPYSSRDFVERRESFQTQIIDSRHQDDYNTSLDLVNTLKENDLAACDKEVGEKQHSKLTRTVDRDENSEAPSGSRETQNDFVNKDGLDIVTKDTRDSTKDRTSGENCNKNKSYIESSEEQREQLETTKCLANLVVKKRSPSLCTKNKGKNFISLEDIGVNVRPPKMHLSAYRIPKIKKNSEDISPKHNVCENQAKVSTTELILKADTQHQTEKQIKEIPKSLPSTASETRTSRKNLFNNDAGFGPAKAAMTKSKSKSSSEQYLNVIKTSEPELTKHGQKSVHFSSEIAKPKYEEAKLTENSTKPIETRAKSHRSISDSSGTENLVKTIKNSVNELNKTSQSSKLGIGLKRQPLSDQLITTGSNKNETNTKLRLRRKSQCTERFDTEGAANTNIQVDKPFKTLVTLAHRRILDSSSDDEDVANVAKIMKLSQNSQAATTFKTLPQDQIITTGLKKHKTTKELRLRSKSLYAESSHTERASSADIQVDKPIKNLHGKVWDSSSDEDIGNVYTNIKQSANSLHTTSQPKTLQQDQEIAKGLIKNERNKPLRLRSQSLSAERFDTEGAVNAPVQEVQCDNASAELERGSIKLQLPKQQPTEVIKSLKMLKRSLKTSKASPTQLKEISSQPCTQEPIQQNSVIAEGKEMKLNLEEKSKDNIQQINAASVLVTHQEDKDELLVATIPAVITNAVESAFTLAEKSKRRRRRVVKVLSTSTDSTNTSTNNSQQSSVPPSPFTSPLLNHPIFNNEVSTQSSEFAMSLPLTPNQQDDSELKEIDSKLNELFKSPTYAAENADRNLSVTTSSNSSFLTPHLSSTKTETLDVNEKETSSRSLNNSQLNSSLTSLNESQSVHNTTEVKYLSMGSSKYRFEKISDNVVNLFITRKRKRKSTN